VIQDDILKVEKPDRLIRLKLAGGWEAGWTVLEANGACTGLTGSGDYRITDTPLIRVDGNLDFASAAPEPTPTPTPQPTPPAQPKPGASKPSAP
jgi:hypothetical protein